MDKRFESSDTGEVLNRIYIDIPLKRRTKNEGYTNPGHNNGRWRP